MYRRVATAAVLFSLCLPFVAQTKPAATQKPPLPDPIVKVGSIAPDFKMKDQSGKEVTLSSFRGKKNVVLAFYVFAFTGGWEKEMRAYQERLAELEATDTQVMGVSMDSTFANRAFAEKIGVTFPLLSDRNGNVSREYGIYNPEYEASRRVTYLIDKSGKVVEMQVDKDAIDPSNVVIACKRIKMKT